MSGKEKEPLKPKEEDKKEEEEKYVFCSKFNIMSLAIVTFGACIIALSCALAFVMAPEQDTSNPQLEALAALSTKLVTLRKDITDFWLAHGLDIAYGGFHGTLDRRGLPKEPYYKGVVQTARHLWALSALSPVDKDPRVAENAQNLRAWLDRYLDSDGRFNLVVYRNGTLMDPALIDGQTLDKSIYTQSFAIYALSEYAIAFKDAGAADIAYRCFLSLDAAHDPVNKGYNEARLLPSIQKSTVTHLHLLEAFSALYEATKNVEVQVRLLEIVDVIIHKIKEPEGYCFQYFTSNWTLVGEPTINFGHNLGIVHLLLEAIRVLPDLPQEKRQEIFTAASEIAKYSVDNGIDVDDGACFHVGLNTGEIVDADKYWWVQAECIYGVWTYYGLSGPDDNPELLEVLDHLLSFVESNIQDDEFGEWYPTATANITTANKGSFWKASYHNVRATTFVQTEIDEYIAAHGSSDATSQGTN